MFRREIGRRYRDLLREARSVAQRDGEAFAGIIQVVERLGMQRKGEVGDLGKYQEDLCQLAEISPLAKGSSARSSFRSLYANVRIARNDAMHVGAKARWLTSRAVELALVLEDALMSDAGEARDYMVQPVAVAEGWQLISDVRQVMLANSFTYLPVRAGGKWFLISDLIIARYLWATGDAGERRLKMAQSLDDAIEAKGIALQPAPVCDPSSGISNVLEISNGRPVLVCDGGRLIGIVTPFDVL